MRNFYSFLLVIFAFLSTSSCGPSNRLAKYYTPEDKSVLETIEKLNKSPNDPLLKEVLKNNYAKMLQNKAASVKNIDAQMGPGEKYKRIITELQIMQQIRAAILKSSAALLVIPQPSDFTEAIQNAKNKGAQDYYTMGIEYLKYNNRPYAEKAYNAFYEAYRLNPAYLDVSQKMQLARELATVKVIVNKVNYYNQRWDYWGFDNDYLQWKMISDLNRGSWSNVKFYTAEQAASQDVHPDCIVNLQYTSFNFGNVFTDRNTITRSKQIETGQTKSHPPQPIYTTVYATITITKQYISNRGLLECRIYDVASNKNILFDNFPGDYKWSSQTATYTGDSRALTQEDLNMINSKYSNPPNRSEIARKIIDQSYNSLINRIRSSVQFSY